MGSQGDPRRVGQQGGRFYFRTLPYPYSRRVRSQGAPPPNPKVGNPLPEVGKVHSLVAGPDGCSWAPFYVLYLPLGSLAANAMGLFFFAGSAATSTCSKEIINHGTH